MKGVNAGMVVGAEDGAYFKSRAVEEQEAADKAEGEKARNVHLRLASRYQEAADRCSRLKDLQAEQKQARQQLPQTSPTAAS
jgi:hypothetical protein